MSTSSGFYLLINTLCVDFNVDLFSIAWTLGIKKPDTMVGFEGEWLF